MRDWQKTEIQETGMVDVDGITLLDLIASLRDTGLLASEVTVDGRLTAPIKAQKRRSGHE